jgi:hypothetical protein
MQDNRSLIEILNRVSSDLQLLADNGALFGRGNQLDLLKCSNIIADMTNEVNNEYRNSRKG